MGRWIEITGTSKVDIERRLMKMSDKLFGFLEGEIKAVRYAKPGSSIRLHKTELKGIMKIPKTTHPWWKKIKNRVGEVPGWVTPKRIANDDENYFNKDI